MSGIVERWDLGQVHGDEAGLQETDIRYDPGAEAEFPLLREMWVEKGVHADWDLLSPLHYKLHSLPVGANFWRLRFRDDTIGVCVMGVSRPLLKERHAVFPKLKPGQDSQISNIHRYAYINDNFRTIGRFVVDTMFRSAGVAYRFANLASRMHGYRFIEIQSSMSKYNPFAQRAGFQMVRPIRSIHYDTGIKFMRRWFASHPADQEALMEEFNAMSPALQTRVEQELKDFYYDHSPLEKTGSRRHTSEGVVDRWPMRRAIGKIQGLCFSSPLYGFYRNPDAGMSLPDKLPLVAFDLQNPSEPLRQGLVAALPCWSDLQGDIVARDWHEPAHITAAKNHEREEHDKRRATRAVPAAKKLEVTAKTDD